MELDRTIDITAEQRKTVLALLARHLPNTAAWVYGSRAKWASRPQSDLDLVVFATPEQASRVSDLREAFEESNLPFRVDLFVWDAVPERFRKRIEVEHVVLVVKEKRREESGCKTLPAEEFCSSVRDGTHDSPKPVDQGRYLITSRHIVGRHVDLTSAYLISQQDFDTINRRSKVNKWDVLLTMIGTVGEPCLIKEEPDFAIKNIGLFKSKGEVEGKWLYYYLCSPKVQRLIREQSRGTTQAYIPLGPLRQFPVVVPVNWGTMSAIAHILGTLDDKIELNRRMNETLEAMARALFTSWFVDFDPVRAKMESRDTGLPKDIADLFPDRLVASELGEIPKGWKVGTLEDVASLNPESWSTRNAPEEIVYVDLSNTKWGYIEKVETYSWKAAPSRGRRVLRHGDTIVGTVRPGNGSFSLVGRDGLTGSTGFAVLRPKTPSDAELVWCAATSQDNIDRLAHLADGGAYPAVRPEAVAATKLPLADFATRGAFSSVAASLLNQVDANKQQSHTLVDLRDTLLPRLISGELRAKQIEPESSISNISPDATGVQA